MEHDELKRWYFLRQHKCTLFCIVSLAIAVFLVILNISLGEYNIGFVDSYMVIWKHIIGSTDYTWRDNHVIWDLRLPRAIAAFSVGAILAISGAAMQSSLKNPLADPYTIGISSGASLGVILAAAFGICIIPTLDAFNKQVVNAFLFALIPMTMILLFSSRGKSTPATIILVGIGVMYVFSAITTTLMIIIEPEEFADIYMWTLGSVSSITWDILWLVVLIAVILTVLMRYFAPILNILSAPDNVCKSFGINPKRSRAAILTIVSLGTAATVCYTGTIGFVGLIVPHIGRMIVGSDNKILIPTCAGLGGIFLLLADSITKLVKYGTLPVGVITSLIGCPLFIFVMIKYKRLSKGF